MLTMPLADPEKAVLSVQGRTRPKDSGDSSASAVVASRAAPVATAAVVEAVGSSDADADERARAHRDYVYIHEELTACGEKLAAAQAAACENKGA